MTSADDAAILQRIVDPRTFARGFAYAQSGAVLSREWLADGTRVVGDVRGGAARPYQVSVTITRSSVARLQSFTARCSCPVGVNCKHAVALFLAPEESSLVAPSNRPHPPRPDQRATKGITARRAVRGAEWEMTLRRLLTDATPDDGSSDLGLFFELVEFAKTRDIPVTRVGSRVRVRPVALSRSGNWTTTGISWSHFDSYHYGRATGDHSDRAHTIVRELLAVSRVSRPQSYAYHDDVWLEDIASRRLWDILRDARDAGVPLLSSTRPPHSVTVESVPAVVMMDVRRREADVALEPSIDVSDVRVPTDSSRLIGDPAHGVVWWDRADDGHGVTALHLAAFSTSLDPVVRRLLRSEPIIVPAGDEARFFAELYPVLSAGVDTISSDGSVTLPEPVRATLVLSLSYGGGRLSLTWAKGRTGSSWRGELWSTWSRTLDRHYDGVIAEVTRILSSTRTLFTETPWGEFLVPVAELEGVGAVSFVTELLPALVDLLDVEIEWTGAIPDFREAVEPPVVKLAGASSLDGDWFDLAVEVSVGAEVVAFQDLFVAIADGQSHLILPSGTYFSLDRDDLRQLGQCIVEARALHDVTSGVARISRFQASLWEDLRAIGVVSSQTTAWDVAVRSLAEAVERPDYVAPPGLNATLRPYQLEGFNWLAYLYEHGLGGVLADDMGLGKTVQALALICHVRHHDLSHRPFLVIAPTSVVQNWASECRRFAPDLIVSTVRETSRRRSTSLTDIVTSADVVVTSYALFRLDADDYGNQEWAGVFFDEAQFAKNRNSKTHQAIKLLPVSFKVAMTGTPLENNLMELWALMSITAPGLLASPERFEKYYRTPIERLGDAERLAQLRRRLRPLMLRRTKEQVVAELPEKFEQVLELELNPRHRKVYQTYLARERQKVLGLLDDVKKNRFQIFRSLTLLRQASLDVSLVDATHARVPSTKLDALMEMIDDIVADGHRVLIFSQFTRFLAGARQRIEGAGYEYCYLDGRTRKREKVIEAFRDGDAPIFLISLKAGGFGLNLTEADYCILLDPWWNPATEAQAVDRVHRIGQTRKVMVYRFVAKDTIEERVMALKARKSQLFASVLEGGEFASSSFSADDIRELLG